MQDAPAERLLQGLQAARQVVDRQGRTIALRRLGALDKLRIYKAAGPELAQNHAWLGLAMLASCVTEIDGIPAPLPTTEQQIEFLVDRLGDDGIEAVASTLDPEPGLDRHLAGN